MAPEVQNTPHAKATRRALPVVQPTVGYGRLLVHILDSGCQSPYMCHLRRMSAVTTVKQRSTQLPGRLNMSRKAEFSRAICSKKLNRETDWAGAKTQVLM